MSPAALRQGQRQGQQQEMRQTMSLTQQMRSSLSLLQMGTSEILSELEKESRRNPFLRMRPPGMPTGQGGDQTAPELAETTTTAQDLLHQVGLVRLSAAEQTLAAELVYSLDDRGFFEDSAEQMAVYLSASSDQIRQLAQKLQETVEPAGIFVWSLAECFAAQLRAQNRYDPLIARLLERLDLIASQDLDAIAQHCGVDLEDAEDMLADIRSLSPSPLTPQTDLAALARAPDLIVRMGPDGLPEVALNPLALPDILVDDAFFSTVGTAETDTSALAYYKDCYRGAGGFVLAMQKRANTLLKIGQIVARVQARFFQTGRMIDRKPLTMTGLAEELGMHKSTVSRGLNNCLLECEHGVLEVAQLLVRPLTEDMAQKTRDQALKRLALLIKTEDKTAPLSDQDLSERMCKFNLTISRRTVAKYRTLLGEPNALQRKRRR